MTQYVINIGAIPNDGTGDPLRTAFNETNLNFDQVFAAGPVLSNVRIANNSILTLNTNGNLILAPNGIGVVQSNTSIVPNLANIRDLGSSTQRWRNVYTQYVNISGTATIASANIAGGTITIPVGNIHISGGTNGEYLQTDGTGNLTWAAFGGSGNGVPGGANTQVQYNNGNGFGGTAGFTFDNTSNVLTVDNVSAGTMYSPNFYGNAVMYANATGYLTNTNLFKYNPETEILTVGAVSTTGNVTSGNLNSPTLNNSGNISVVASGNTWTFGTDGSTIFPTLTTQRGDNPSGTISGQTLLFGDATQEAIISTPDGSNADGINSQRLVINPGKGEDSNGGEGGDIYLWAGRGGANSGSGGDVKIRGGYAPADGTGGYIRMDGGESQGNGAPGFIEITGGQGGTTSGGYVQITGGVGGSGTGGAVDLIGGFGQAGPGAAVTITGGGSANGLAEYGNVNIAAGASTWSFRNNGTTQFPNNTINPGNNQDLTIRTQSSGNAYTIAYQNSNSWEAYAEDDTTEAYAAWAWIHAQLGTANTPQVFIQNVRGNDGLESTWTFDDAGKITLPYGASLNDTSGDSVAFGQNAGLTSQAQHAVAIGSSAGSQYQGEDSIAIGYQAGYQNQSRGVAIGYQSGYGGTLYRSVSDAQGGSGPVTTYVSGDGNPRLYVASTTNIDTNQRVFGNNIQTGTYVTAVYPGEDRVDINQIPTATLTAGDTLTFVSNTIGIDDASDVVYPMRVTGTNIPANTFVQSAGCSVVTLNQYPTAPLTDGASLQFTIGQGAYSTAIGYAAGYSFQGDGAVAIGYSAGRQNQSLRAVAVGEFAGYSNQSDNAVSVGQSAGEFTQGINTVAIGYRTGGNTQGARAVAIGEDAGNDNQHAGAVAIGAESGRIQQGNAAIAMGWKAGNYYQGLNAIAIGEDAGRDNQGAYSIAIGFYAGFNSQANNTVVLNATGSYLTASTANTFVVKPIRNSSTGNVLYYDQTSGEITFDTGSTANTGNVTFSDQIVIGTGISNLISGLYLAPSSSSANAVQYLRVRGDVTYEPTHIHFDTGNNQYFNQFIGDDNKYVLLSNTGNIVINTDNYAGNSAQWTFGVDGNLTLPGNIVGSGNILIAPDSASASSYLDIYLTGGPDIHIAGNDNSIVIGRDTGANVFVGNDGEVSIRTDNGATAQVWNFTDTGNTTFPNGAVFTGYDLYAAANSYVELAGDTGNTYMGVGNTSAFIQTDWNGAQKQWDFLANGVMTAPGAISAVGNVTGGNIVTSGSGGDITLTGGNITGVNNISTGIITLTNGAVLKDTATYAVAFGKDAGLTSQGQEAVAVGHYAGRTSQGNGGVAIGVVAGNSSQGQDAVAVGSGAGRTNQGSTAVAVGSNAGATNQGNNSIIINATGSVLNQTTANTFTVAPVRNDNSNIAEVMFYNTTSKEITYGNTISVSGNVTAANFFGNGNTLSNVATQVTGSWDVPVGNSTQSFTVSPSNTYLMWVDCNIPNGILTWNATGTVTNTNVPVVGAQYAWVYTGGGTPIDFTSIPNQFVGTSNTIVRSSVAPSATTNRFDFGINNTSGGNVTVRYGWAQIS